ncbi:putative cytoplasmic protein [Geomicrobium sp. JCM 19037]|nr:putative cytoplasmic protein [Geomicrobium sp. JCM 19037]
MSKFYDDIDFHNTDFRKHPERYRVGRGEQGVLLVEPYKSEILPNWRFKSVPIAEESSEKIYEQYAQYKKAGDFVGMDMARKFLQMATHAPDGTPIIQEARSIARMAK